MDDLHNLAEVRGLKAVDLHTELALLLVGELPGREYNEGKGREGGREMAKRALTRTRSRDTHCAPTRFGLPGVATFFLMDAAAEGADAAEAAGAAVASVRNER